ncbi:hypothetical protein [Demequina sp. NBRC 110054]|uniref:hypothetical protein n=1 Tax=Demequina sp. NBRC 110054 TaxID=1570343 RepID=UPI00135642B2|nr:hypothetical protein [Demequina sp. NBRC 110054]
MITALVPLTNRLESGCLKLLMVTLVVAFVDAEASPEVAIKVPTASAMASAAATTALKAGSIGRDVNMSPPDSV